MLALIRRAITTLERAPITLGTWFITLTALIIVRLAIESLFADFTFHFSDYFFYYFTDFFFSFAFTILTVTFIVRWAGRLRYSEASSLTLTAFIVAWLPPIIDELLSYGNGFLSFYSFDSLNGLFHRYLTFFGADPTVGITYGVRSEIALVVIAIMGYTYFKTLSWWRTLGAGLALYSLLFIIAALPSFVVIGLMGWEKGFLAVSETDIATFMLRPELLFGLPQPEISSVLNLKVSLLFVPLLSATVALTLFSVFRPIWTALLRNARFPQIIYHAGLFLIGGGLVWQYSTPVFKLDFFHWLGLFSLLMAIAFAWLASVVVNDIHDQKIDRLTNSHRPLITQTINPTTFATIGWIFFGMSLLLAALVSTQAMLLLVVYQCIAWTYSALPLRLKRFPLIATALAAAASLTVFFLGFIVFSVDKNITALPWSIPTLLFIAYTFLLPIKDFKDIPGDRSDGVLTLPVLLGETKAKRFIGSVAFILFPVSVFVLDIRSLFPLAFFFGSLAYWLLQISTSDHPTFSYRRLAGWYIALTSVYVSFLAWHLFSKM